MSFAIPGLGLPGDKLIINFLLRTPERAPTWANDWLFDQVVMVMCRSYSERGSNDQQKRLRNRQSLRSQRVHKGIMVVKEHPVNSRENIGRLYRLWFS